MPMTATEVRKNLFAVLDRVLAGENVEILYKGSVVRLTVGGSPSKLSRAKRSDTLLCDPGAIVHSDPELLKKMEAELTKDR